jgi:hypothetical protein
VDEFIGYFLLMEALGTIDNDFLIGLLGQLSNAGSQGRELDPVGINFMISVIKGIQPRDPVEAMLASQKAAVHMASMTLARRLAPPPLPSEPRPLVFRTRRQQCHPEVAGSGMS